MLSTNIKEATKEAHQQLEKKVILKLKSIRSNADYADLLKHFYVYFNAVEQTVAPYITNELLPDHAERRNSAYLKADIKQLGGDLDDLPAVQTPQIGNVASALGALYVIEGSIMGGSIIVQMLAKYGITEGVSFFSGYGEATGQMWGKFIGVMNTHVQTEEEEEQAITAANETFSRFSDVFGEVSVAS
jgi:heme oxygenase (biliverdin-IX-beta and delta-forming)